MEEQEKEKEKERECVCLCACVFVFYRIRQVNEHLGCCGCERGDRDVRKALLDEGHLLVRGTEVVSPLADAVRLFRLVSSISRGALVSLFMLRCRTCMPKS
jgi:hypothetical protein